VGHQGCCVSLAFKYNGDHIMKRLVTGLLASVLATPALAADPTDRIYYQQPGASDTSGSVGASVGALIATDGDESETATVYNFSGTLNSRFGPRWNGQFDARYNGASMEGDTLAAYGGGVHVYWRDPAAYAVGGFAAIDWLDFDDLDGDAYSYRVGPEFQIYRGNMTYYGQAYYGQYIVDGESADTWGIRGEARYFHTENLRFEGELAFTRISDGGDGARIFTVGLEAEKRFDNSPVSVWGRYQLDNVDVEDENVTGHSFLIGLRAAFGTGSLFDEDRNGATMETPKTSQVF